MRNILVLVGSGTKKGNTSQLADAFCKGATKAGHRVHKVFLGDKKLSGCQGCEACKGKNPICIIKDDMQEIYPLINQCDTIVLASPLYFWTISAKIKAFIERLYAIAENDQFPPKETVLLMTAGDDNFWTFEQPISYYSFVTKAIRWKNIGMCLAGGCKSDPKNKYIDEKFLQRAHELGTMI
ncbi:flavodoxin family protein [Irregularibacter muris]|uniref:Flavodoxin family protein n=1 Tax=Irregularibacter muris TaxID=1796619 RepID=A0AAE3L0D3_9FIRM|nr:flavodoxin family protein [Irregularibacter muris]MCR1900151.1 flavodoxin family protein [Irregularibacter muris]